MAAEIIGNEWRDKLGIAYPLVLMFVRSALEDGRRPGEAECNTYHVLSNYGSIGVLCAAVMERKKSWCPKTLQRWLNPNAPHAAALRCWLGWRHWYTDTLLEYRRGENPETGEAYQTGKSRGPVIGGTLFRVRLTPLSEIGEERLKACDEKRPSVIQPLKPELEHQWRDLEQDRHEGLTWQHGEHSIALEDIDVQIDRISKRSSIQNSFGVLFRNQDKTNEQFSGSLLSQNYLYPDITTEAGALKLRLDVERTANILLEQIEGIPTGERRLELLNRYRHAVWTAYKTHRYGDSRAGYELLNLGWQLAKELRVRREQAAVRGEPFTIRDAPAFVWSVVERKGFAELRREYGGYQEGRYMRVFSSSMAGKLGMDGGMG